MCSQAEEYVFIKTHANNVEIIRKSYNQYPHLTVDVLWLLVGKSEMCLFVRCGCECQNFASLM